MSNPIGLTNQGNTCYMNSALQFITNSKYIAESLVRKQKQGKYSSAGAELVLAKKKGQSVTPSQIKSVMGNKYHVFAGFGQQDSHEFISTYINEVEAEQNEIKDKKPYKEFQYDNTNLQQSYEVFIENKRGFETSDLQRQLQFTVLQEITCSGCNYKSVAFFADESIVVDCESLFSKIKSDDSDTGVKKTFFSCYKSQQNKLTDLQNCLKNYFESQLIDERKCEKCSKVCDAELKKYLFTTPKQLIITFKRFRGYQKISHTIKYEEFINLSEFLHPEADPNQKTEFVINVVSLHSGSCHGGHYTAYVRNEEGKFFNCDDSHIREINQIDWNDSRAYVLSYSQK